MAQISVVDALGMFTKYMMKLLILKPEVDKFFKQFFQEEVSAAEGTNFEVIRSGRQIVNDIGINDEPIITHMRKSTEKLFIPPNIDLAVSVSALDAYNRIAGQTGYVNDEAVFTLASDTAKEVQINLDRIERREELMCAQALESGIVSLDKGTDVDYKRRAGSLIAYSAGIDWNIQTVDPGKVLIQMAEFMVTYGLVGPGDIINIVMGDDALTAFQNNTKIKERAEVRRMNFMNLSTGAQIGKGATPQGMASFGNYTFNIWGYSGRYEDKDGNTVKYMNPKKVIALPNSPDFKMFYGGTKAWIGDGESKVVGIVKGKRNFYKVRDELKVSELHGVRTRPLPILREVDRVATATVIAP